MGGWTWHARSTLTLTAVAAVVVGGCTPPAVGGSVRTDGAQAATEQTPARTVAFDLFDGRTLNGWRVYRGSGQPRGWYVKDGALTKEAATDDIITTEQFGNFELELDWRIHSGGNAGIFYRVTEEYEKPYWSGVEYQLLDDANHPDGKNRLTAAGAAFGLYPAQAGIVKPAGEWNRTRIVARGTKIEHWLNGEKLLTYDTGSPEFGAKVAASKFSAWPNFAKSRRGYIAIQGDHGGELSLRHIRIRELR